MKRMKIACEFKSTTRQQHAFLTLSSRLSEPVHPKAVAVRGVRSDVTRLYTYQRLSRLIRGR